MSFSQRVLDVATLGIVCFGVVSCSGNVKEEVWKPVETRVKELPFTEDSRSREASIQRKDESVKPVLKKKEEVHPVVEKVALKNSSSREIEAIPRGKLTSIDLTTLYPMHQSGGVVCIDARSSIFYTLGHIDGAISLPLKQRASKLPSLLASFRSAMDEGKVLVVYCGNSECPDAASLGRKMVEEGLDVCVYEAGWAEWKAADL